jgi:predicted transcriptional regulator
MDVIFRLGQASVKEVHESMPDPPSYSAVRTMIGHLEKKGLLKHQRDGLRYVYSPTDSQKSASQSAVTHLIKTFFQGSVGQAAAAILDSKSAKLSEEDLCRIEAIIEQARGRKS